MFLQLRFYDLFIMFLCYYYINYFIILIEEVSKNIILNAKYGIKAIYMKVLIGLKTLIQLCMYHIIYNVVKLDLLRIIYIYIYFFLGGILYI